VTLGQAILPHTGRPFHSQGDRSFTRRLGLSQGEREFYKEAWRLKGIPGLSQGSQNTYRKKMPLKARPSPSP